MSPDELEAALDAAAALLRPAGRVCVLTGAGVSAESGVPTFRAADGLWEGHRIEEVATPDGFRTNPDLVWAFYNARRANVGTVRPNPAHRALFDMERRWGRRFAVATQNVDGLHQAAGSTNVFELHGSLRRTRCTQCGVETDRGLEPLGPQPLCPACNGRLRPAIVWFHEMLPDGPWEAAKDAAERCDVFLLVGTAAVVFPAAGLVATAKRRGDWDAIRRPAAVIEVNLVPTNASHLADVGLYAPAGQVLPELVKRLGPDPSD